MFCRYMKPVWLHAYVVFDKRLIIHPDSLPWPPEVRSGTVTDDLAYVAAFYSIMQGLLVLPCSSRLPVRSLTEPSCC
jgi:hypothetical protein